MVANVGPAYEHAWRTADEMAFVHGLGSHRRPAWTPADSDSPRGYRVLCLRGYLAAFEARAIRGSVDWMEIRALAVRLLREAEERAA